MMANDKQFKYANEMVNYLTQLSECSGKVTGLSMLIRSMENRRGKRIDSDFIAGELLDIADEINSVTAQMRFTVFPFNSDDDHIKKEMIE